MVALNFGRPDIDNFAAELSYKDFCLWQLQLNSNGGLTVESRILTALEPKLADMLVVMYAKAGVKTKQADFLSGFNLYPVGYDAIKAKNDKIINEIRRRRWDTVSRQIYLEKTDSELAAKRYKQMKPWFKVAYDSYKKTGDKSTIDDLPINP